MSEKIIEVEIPVYIQYADDLALDGQRIANICNYERNGYEAAKIVLNRLEVKKEFTKEDIRNNFKIVFGEYNKRDLEDLVKTLFKD